MQLRHQLPAHSPIPVRAILLAARAVARVDADGEELQRVLRERYAATQVTLCGSGTEALQLALDVALRRVAPAPVARIVALPAYGCFDLATAAVGVNAQVLLYDLDPRTLGPDEASLERALASGAKVVVAAPLFGVPIPWDAIHAQSSRHGAVLIEDAAQGHGASWGGRPLGSLGVLSVLSFGRGKGWTGGRGGAVLARGGWMVPVMQHDAGLRGGRCVIGLTGHWMFGRPAVYGIPRSVAALGLGETTYHPPGPVRAMPSAARAALLATRDAADDEARHRRAMAEVFARELGGSPSVRTTPVEGGEAGWLRFPVRVRTGFGGLANPERAARLGIAPGYPLVLGELAVLRPRLGKQPSRWPGAAALVRELVTLPTHSLVACGEHEEIVRMFTRNARRRRDLGDSQDGVRCPQPVGPVPQSP